jgi:hypothetical protein
MTLQQNNDYKGQYQYEQNCAAQAEFEAQEAFFEYLENLLKEKNYELHAIEICLQILNSPDYLRSALAIKDYLNEKRKTLVTKMIIDANKLKL